MRKCVPVSEIIKQHPGIYQTVLVSGRFIVIQTFVIISGRYGALWNGVLLMVNVNESDSLFSFYIFISVLTPRRPIRTHTAGYYRKGWLLCLFIMTQVSSQWNSYCACALIVVPNKWMWMNEFKKFCERSEQCWVGFLLLTFSWGVPVTTRKCRLTASRSN